MLGHDFGKQVSCHSLWTVFSPQITPVRGMGGSARLQVSSKPKGGTAGPGCSSRGHGACKGRKQSRQKPVFE